MSRPAIALVLRLLLSLLAIPADAQKGVHPEIWFAHSVVVTASDGSDVRGLYDSRLPLDERTVLSNIEDKLRKCGPLSRGNSLRRCGHHHGYKEGQQDEGRTGRN
jgi:hypothetical protein